MIPKTIHYCWFGKKELPDSAKKCIESWKKYCVDYEIKLWNEDNFDINENMFISQAYEARKYAFVSDYARFKILYEHGGIYMDTDVELIKPLDDLLKNNAFMGFEKANKKITGIAPGLIIGTEKEAPFLKNMIEIYNNSIFFDENGSQKAYTVVKYMTDYLLDKGCLLEDRLQCVDNITLYPTAYFCPKDYETGEINITEKTYSIHHYDSTWWPEKSLYLRKLIEKYGAKNGVLIYRLTIPFNFKLWWRIIHEKR